MGSAGRAQVSCFKIALIPPYTVHSAVSKQIFLYYQSAGEPSGQATYLMFIQNHRGHHYDQTMQTGSESIEIQ